MHRDLFIYPSIYPTINLSIYQYLDLSRGDSMMQDSVEESLKDEFIVHSDLFIYPSIYPTINLSIYQYLDVSRGDGMMQGRVEESLMDECILYNILTYLGEMV